MSSLVLSTNAEKEDNADVSKTDERRDIKANSPSAVAAADVILEKLDPVADAVSEDDESSTAIISVTSSITQAKKTPRKVVEDEKRAVGRIKKDVWEAYITAFGKPPFWLGFVVVLILAAISPVAENW